MFDLRCSEVRKRRNVQALRDIPHLRREVFWLVFQTKCFTKTLLSSHIITLNFFFPFFSIGFSVV
jgi:hypothetical protein